MKKLITKTTLFLFPIFILLVSFEYLLRSIPNDYSYKKKYLDDNAEKLEVLILGNSHASYGINPDFIHLAAFNNSHGSQTIDYDYQIFQKYFDKLTRLKYIILPIDYFTLFIRLENGWEEYRKKYYNIYYGMCFGSTPDNYLEILNNKFSLNLKRVWMFYIRKKTLRNCNNNGSATFNQEQKKFFLNNGKYRAAIYTSKTKKNLLSSIEILDKFIAKAYSIKTKVILLTMPAEHSYIKYLNSEQLYTTIHLAENFAAKYPNVKYYNLINNTRFVNGDFFDSDHLNEKGAKKLSMKLDSIIKRF